jgi:hypothetical protein
VLSFVLFHRIAAVGTPRVANARSNVFSMDVVLYEMPFDAPAGRVTDETGLLPVGRQSNQSRVTCRSRFLDNGSRLALLCWPRLIVVENTETLPFGFDSKIAA